MHVVKYGKNIVYVTLMGSNPDFGNGSRIFSKESKSIIPLMCRTSRPPKGLLSPLKSDNIHLKYIAYVLKFGEAKSAKFGSFQTRKTRNCHFKYGGFRIRALNPQFPLYRMDIFSFQVLFLLLNIHHSSISHGNNLVDQYLITFIHKGGFLIVKNKVNIL